MVSRAYTESTGENEFQDIRYELIGLNEMYMDFAGIFPKDHAIHHRLNRLEAGQTVSFHRNNAVIEVHDTAGGCVARLSEEGAGKWSQRLNRIREVRVVALLQRDRDDPAQDFQNRIKVDQWALPVLEVVYAPGKG